MINIEEVFEEVFNTIPTYQLPIGGESDNLFYDLGDQKELDRVLITRQENGKKTYPLLWYKLPNEISENEVYARGDFEFVLATNTELDWFNDQRFENSYKHKLYPNLQLVLQAFRGADNITLNKVDNNNFYRRTNFPNYGEAVTGGKQPEDYWDALLLKVNLTITNNCVGQIRYDTKNIF